MKLPCEAKRVDGTHAVIYDADGMIAFKTPGREDAWEIAQHAVETLNAYPALVRETNARITSLIAQVDRLRFLLQQLALQIDLNRGAP